MIDQATLDDLKATYRLALPSPAYRAFGDVAVFPQGILLGRVIQDYELAERDIGTLLTDPTEMNRFLEEARKSQPNGSAKENRGKKSLDAWLEDASKEPDMVVKRGEQDVYVGKTQPHIYTYPSGRQVAYHLVVQEFADNYDILNFGFSKIPPGVIYIRESFVKLMRALANVAKLEGKLPDVQLLPPTFENDIVGISISHELAEISLDKDGDESLGLERELAAEQRSREMLHREGVNETSYRLFHYLRKGNSSPESGSVSAHVLRSLK